MSTDPETIHAIARENRLRAADLFAALTEDQWSTPSLCAGWTVREVCGHLVQPLEQRIGVLGLVAALVRHRGSLDRMVDATARRSAQRPTAELVARLRELADVRLDPPAIGPIGPMCDSLVHLRDVARPLGSDVDAPAEHWRVALDFLSAPGRASRGLLPDDRLEGLRLEAADVAWAHGEGYVVRGPAEALTMAITGRAVALADLTGDGVDVLRRRLDEASPPPPRA